MKNLFLLFWEFFKLGLFTFGGGYAMIPQLKDIVITKYHWISDDELLDVIAVAESTPGPIAINLATYIGYKKNKILGSIFATLGVVIPSLVIIFIISLFFKQFMALKYVKYAFVGIKCAVAILIIKAAINMLKSTTKNIFSISCFIVVFVLMILFELFNINFSSIYFIIIGGILGIVIYSLIERRKDLWFGFDYFLNSLK